MRKNLTHMAGNTFKKFYISFSLKKQLLSNTSHITTLEDQGQHLLKPKLYVSYFPAIS